MKITDLQVQHIHTSKSIINFYIGHTSLLCLMSNGGTGHISSYDIGLPSCQFILEQYWIQAVCLNSCYGACKCEYSLNDMSTLEFSKIQKCVNFAGLTAAKKMITTSWKHLTHCLSSPGSSPFGTWHTCLSLNSLN